MAKGELRTMSVVLSTAGLEPPLVLEKKVWVELAYGDRPFAAALSISAELRSDIALDPPQIDFPAGPATEQPRAQLTIHRDMLSPGEFASLRVVAPASHYTLEHIARETNEARVAIRLEGSDSAADPPPLELRYERDGLTRSVPVQVSRRAPARNVRLVPSSYIANFDREPSVAAHWGPSAQQIRLTAIDARLRVTVTALRRSDKQQPRLFGWDILPNKPDRFVVWQEKAPLDQSVQSEVLRVAYQLQDQQGVIRGEIPFTAYALSGSFAEHAAHRAQHRPKSKR